MSQDPDRVYRRLLVLESIVGKLLSTRPCPNEVCDRKLTEMENLVAELSDRDSIGQQRDQFSHWKERVSKLWELFASGGLCDAEKTTAGTDRSDRLAASSSRAASQPSALLQPLPPPPPPPTVASPQLPQSLPRLSLTSCSDGFFKIKPPSRTDIPKHEKIVRRKFEVLSRVSSMDRLRDRIQGLKALNEAVSTALIHLIDNKLIGNHSVHMFTLQLAMDKMPRSMVSDFHAVGKASLRTLETFLDKEISLLKSELHERESKYRDDSRSDHSHRDERASTSLALTSNLNPTKEKHSESSSPSVVRGHPNGDNLTVKHEPELEEGEVSSSASGEQNFRPTPLSPRPPSSSSVDEAKENIKSARHSIDMLFSAMPMVESETDLEGLNKMHCTVDVARQIVARHGSPELSQYVYRLAARRLSDSWFWGVQPKKQNAAFMSQFLAKLIWQQKGMALKKAVVVAKARNISSQPTATVAAAPKEPQQQRQQHEEDDEPEEGKLVIDETIQAENMEKDHANSSTNGLTGDYIFQNSKSN